MVQDSTTIILFQIGFLIIIASLGSELFKKLKLPGVIGSILAGIFIGGPGGLGIITDVVVINLLAVLGSILILFVTGLEFDAESFLKVGKKAFVLTTTGVIFSLILGYLAGLALGWSWQAAFILGAVIAPSGTSVIASVLSSENAINTKKGSTLLTAVIVDDIEGILVLTVAMGIVVDGIFSPSNLLRVSLLAIVFILSAIYIGSKIFPTIIKKLEKFFSEEILFAILLGLGLLLAFAATKVGLAAVTGAFIMGAIIPHKKVGQVLAHRLFMMKEIFAAIFFASIGLVINPFGIYFVLPIALSILGVALAARFLGGLLGGRLSGFRGKTLYALAIGLGIKAEMSFIIAYEAVAQGVVGGEFLTITTVVVIGSMIILLPLFSKLLKTTNQ